MNVSTARLLIPMLAFLAVACGPHHRPDGFHHGGHEHWAAHACDHDACAYDGRCSSNGAIRSNDGACQQCNAGQWVSASGCSAAGCDMKDGCWVKHCRGKGKKPCDGKHSADDGHHPPR